MKKLLKILLVSFAIVLIPVVGLAVFFYATIFSDWWIKFPEPQRSLLALERLESTNKDGDKNIHNTEQDSVCEEIVLKELLNKGGDGVVGRRIKEDLKNEEKAIDYRRILIDIVRKSEGEKNKNKDSCINAPVFLLDYLNSGSGNRLLKMKIIDSFSGDEKISDIHLANLLSVIQDENKSVDDKFFAISDLRNVIIAAEKGCNPNKPSDVYKNLNYDDLCGILLRLSEKRNTKDPGVNRLIKRALTCMYECTAHLNSPNDFFSSLENVFYDKNTTSTVQFQIIKTMESIEVVRESRMDNFMLSVNKNESIVDFVRLEAMKYLKDSDLPYQEVVTKDSFYND